MTLAEYLKTNELDEEQFAALSCGAFSAEAVRKWRFGARVPRREHMVMIAKLTDNHVTANDLLAGAAERVERQRKAAAA